MTKEQIIKENVSLRQQINKAIFDLVKARRHKDANAVAECIWRIETLLVDTAQHLQCVEDYLMEE